MKKIRGTTGLVLTRREREDCNTVVLDERIEVIVDSIKGRAVKLRFLDLTEHRTVIRRGEVEKPEKHKRMVQTLGVVNTNGQ